MFVISATGPEFDPFDSFQSQHMKPVLFAGLLTGILQLIFNVRVRM
jgi:hypothetical protein